MDFHRLILVFTLLLTMGKLLQSYIVLISTKDDLKSLFFDSGLTIGAPKTAGSTSRMVSLQLV